ncbi:MAG TPA: hypothetical protein VGN63_07850 [Flavisolibacter sp.]|nr:hypothetical protein [Flavisolibacter sp.]
MTSQLIQRRVPFHFGGMSDPFMQYEMQGKKTFETLTTLKRYKYPTIISTKGIVAVEPEYLKLLSDGLSVVQMSFASLNDEISSLLEFNTPPPTKRLNAIKELSSACWVSARLQPLIPGTINEAVDSIYTLAAAGVKHVSVELLKLPLVGSDNLLKTVSNAYKMNIDKYYSERRIKGLEYLVDCEYSLKVHRRLSNVAKLAGIAYSCADTDLLPFDRSECCCSGVHDLPGFENFYRYTFSQSIRNALRERSSVLEYRHLNCEWFPNGSIKQFLNSKSRIDGFNSIKSWMAWKWNNSTKDIGPLAFYGITSTDKCDSSGMKIYKISTEALQMATEFGFYENDTVLGIGKNVTNKSECEL